LVVITGLDPVIHVFLGLAAVKDEMIMDGRI